LAIPSIVGDIDQDLGAVGNELAYFIRKDRFITNDHSEFGAAEIEDAALRAAREVSHFTSQLAGEEEKLFERHVFAEGDQMNLVIAPDSVPAGIDDQS